MWKMIKDCWCIVSEMQSQKENPSTDGSFDHICLSINEIVVLLLVVAQLVLFWQLFRPAGLATMFVGS